MIILAEDLKNACERVAIALDSKSALATADSLEMYTEDTYLNLCVAASSYFAKVRLNIFEKVEFHATVSASKFLKLISQTTSTSVEMSCTDKFLKIKGSGTYKIPFIFDNEGNLQTLPALKMDVVNLDFDWDTENLRNIAKYNSKVVKAASPYFPVQQMYYIDEHGCLTFTNTSACVNNFELQQSCKFLLNDRIIKLFKLFTNDKTNFKFGHIVNNEIEQVVVQFTDENAELIMIIHSDELTDASGVPYINKVPAAKIRARAENAYKYNIKINKTELSKAINRLMIFDYDKKYIFEFGAESVDISDVSKSNVETIFYVEKQDDLATPYTACLELSEIKSVIDSVVNESVAMKFGDQAAFVVECENIYNVISECKL